MQFGGDGQQIEEAKSPGIQKDRFYSVQNGDENLSITSEKQKHLPPPAEQVVRVKDYTEELEIEENDNDKSDGAESDLEDLFLDAIGEIQRASIALNQDLKSPIGSKLSGSDKNDQKYTEIPEFVEEAKNETQIEQIDPNEPKERTELPWFKDPGIKVSIWAIIKDSIGKDISKLSVPVYFNDPTSLLQKCAQSMEYNHILDKLAVLQGDPSYRLAYMAVYAAAQLTICERNANKPFNPLLGETYEFVTDDFEFLSEQVSHHPPVTANYCRGKKTKYILQNNQKTNTKFSGKCMDFH